MWRPSSNRRAPRCRPDDPARTGPARSADAYPAARPGRWWRPSRNSTIECTMDCGCTVTAIRSGSMSNRRLASMTSSPLFISVDELMVTTGPMFHVGWIQRLLGGDVGHLLARHAAERASDAVTIRRETSAWCRSAATARSRMLGIHRIDSDCPWSGRRTAGCRPPPPIPCSPGPVGSRLQRGDGRLQTDRAGDAVEHHRGTASGDGLHRIRAGLDLRGRGTGAVQRLPQRRHHVGPGIRPPAAPGTPRPAWPTAPHGRRPPPIRRR